MAISQTEAYNMLDRCRNPFKQDLADSTHTVGSPQAITADTPVRFAVDGGTRNVVTSPTYFTDRWDTTNNKMTAVTEYDSPIYKASLSFIFDPTSASSGIFTVTTWIDDATPKKISSYVGTFKGPAAAAERIAVEWYWGEEVGYDAKNDGIYFEIEFSDSGSLYDKTLLIRHAQ